jgi:eukaryotic-like serine/threonine-protein kinase
VSFLDELKRRRVVRVALVYAATAFVVLQAADLLAAGLALPPWVFAAITVVTILGFPFALVLAWAFQITPHGVQRTAVGGDAERWLSRRTVAAVGVALILVLAGGWFINPVVSARLARTAADTGRTDAVIASLLPPPGETWMYGGTSFAVSPDGRTVAVVGFDGGGLRLSLRELDRYTTTALPTTLGATLPFWSPDGRALGFFADGELRVVELATGQVRTLCPAPDPRGGSWNGDDVILYTPSPAGGVHRTTATGGPCEPVPLRDSEPPRPQQTPGRPEPRTGRPYFLGDGQHYVLASGLVSWLGRLGEQSLVLLERHEDPTRSVVAAPDHLLFRTADGALYAQRIDVRRRRLSGTPRRLLDEVIASAGHTAVSTSANGVMVVQGPGSTSFRMLQWTDRTGQVVDSLVVPPAFWVVRPSTRGDRVALGGWQLGLHDRARGVTTVHHRAAWSPLVAPVWAPGDTLLAFMGGGSLGIQVLDPRTGATRALGLPDELFQARPLDWSRDGRLLAFSLRPPGDRSRVEAWVYDLVTGEVRRLFEDPGDVMQMRFSPDGRWVAWHSFARGNTDVYVRPLQGEGAPVRISPDGGAEPRWSVDGRELYFWRPGTTTVMAVTVHPDASPAFSAPRLFRALPTASLSDYEPTPDGGLALLVFGGEQPGYTLILDWTKLLEREERPR